MTELADRGLTRVPVAGRDARVREALLAYGHTQLDPLLRIVQDVRDRDDVAELAMAFAKIYWADTDAAQGRDLTLVRLAQALEIDRGDAIGEAS